MLVRRSLRYLSALLAAVMGLSAACSPDETEGIGSGGASSSASTAQASSGASSGSGSTTASSASGSSSSGSSGGDDLSALSDTFDGPVLNPAWKIVNPGVVNAQQKGGVLSLAMTKPAFWYAGGIGTFAYKLVSGNFKVTATAHARRATAPSEPPNQPIHVGGLMVRDAHGVDQGGAENYVFADVGFAEKGVLAIEYKHTTNSNSVFDEIPWGSGDAELRLCRFNTDVSLYARVPGTSSFQLVKSYTATLPAEVQVGLDVSCASDTDLIMTFDEVTFARLDAAANCAN
jgi:hypothetical protein